jgi:hypothetical protein
MQGEDIIMEPCPHSSCGREKKVWLPMDHFDNDIDLHPWCIHCGVIKNISDDRGRKLGYWMNILSRISRRYSLKQVQRRCIAKNLVECEGFDDLYFIKWSVQKQLFMTVVNKYSKIDLNSLESFIY